MPHVVVTRTLHPPMQRPPLKKGWCQPSLATWMECWPIKQPFLLASSHTLVDVVTTKPKVAWNVVVGPKLLHSNVSWFMSVMRLC